MKIAIQKIILCLSRKCRKFKNQKVLVFYSKARNFNKKLEFLKVNASFEQKNTRIYFDAVF